ncbi:MAG TPA: glycoside hydrolase domain-containing protein, partial [Candidatus Saccharimonadales bacterium]|nr:glycoside hydrolase domain-containing protein [Candidatus Saccharimonadales bacterium]
GFCWYELHILPTHPVKLRSLRLEIPRVANTARYLHTSSYNWSNLSGGLPELGGHWKNQFTPYVWLGDEERGLAWCAESDQGWNLKDPEQAVRVDTKDSIVLFQANLLDREEMISGPIVLRFGLQASPVKPIKSAWRAQARILHDFQYALADPGPDGRSELDRLKEGGVKTVVFHDQWTEYYGQMVPADPAKFEKLIEACHQRGLKLLVYVGYGVARAAPEMRDVHDQWSVIPLIPWEPTYKPKMRGFDATCANSGWADWLVDGADKLFARYHLDGLYFDGTSEAWSCQNEAHGCGWRDQQGKLHPVFPILAARNLMRRLADTMHRHNENAILDVHMSSNLTLPTLAFCDSLWNGEQFEGHTSAENFSVPLPFFRSEFMGYAHGMDMEFLCYENRPFKLDEAIALAWLHGIEVRPYPGTLSHITPIWRVMDRFGVVDAQWRPYWKEPVATSDNASLKVSGWTRRGKALLFVSHLDRKAENVTVHIDSKIHPARASDALTGEAIPLDGNNLHLAFTGMNYRMVEVGLR